MTPTLDTSADSRQLPPRLAREIRTVEVMIGMFCAGNHLRAGMAEQEQTPLALCADCSALLRYASARVSACRFGAEKPTCARCTVHCFRPVMREQIRAVMRYAGPRMTFRHPYLALRHMLDRRPTPSDV